MRLQSKRPSRFVCRTTYRGLPRFRGVAVLEALELRQLLSTTYYVSATGSDSNNGTSQSSPWLSITKVNDTKLSPGDTVLFQGGKSFSGSLQFRSSDGGSSTTPVTIGSYGSGRATISSGTGDGAYDYGTSGIWVENLIFVGSPGSGSQDGVRFEAPNNISESNGRVINCDISGYQMAGIFVVGDNNAGFDNLQFTGNSIHNNTQNGIVFAAQANNVNKNILISNNSIYSNAGINPGSNDTISGSGIQMGGLNGATVEYNDVYNNGATGQGGCGIWCYDSTGVLMQYNISHNNSTKYGHDGDGFDFDLDTQNSIMQFNYSYNNAGAGFMMDQWQGNNDFKNNIIRYNISQDDGRMNTYAGLCVFGSIEDSAIYNNDVYLTPAASVAGIRVKYSALGGSYVSGLIFANNVIDVTGGVQLINIPSDEVHGSNLTFVGNDYYTNGSSVSFAYGSSTYSSLSAWASATGQEMLKGATVGMQVNPDFNSAGAGAALNNGAQLDTLSAYQLASGSPLINEGINVASNYGFPAPSADFFGDAVSQGGAFDIGAYESGGQAASSSGSGTTIGTGIGETTTTGSTGGSSGGTTSGSGKSSGSTSTTTKSGGSKGSTVSVATSSGGTGGTKSGSGKSTSTSTSSTESGSTGTGGGSGTESDPGGGQNSTSGKSGDGTASAGQTGEEGNSTGGGDADSGSDGQPPTAPASGMETLPDYEWQNSFTTAPVNFDFAGLAEGNSVLADVEGPGGTDAGIRIFDGESTEPSRVSAAMIALGPRWALWQQPDATAAIGGDENVSASLSPNLRRHGKINAGYLSEADANPAVADVDAPIALAAASLDAGPILAIFRSVSVEERDVELPLDDLAVPAGWSSADIGDVAVAGNSTFAKGRFILSTSGSRTAGDSDASHFDYARLRGNGQIVAKVNNGAAADSSAGIMIRDGNTAKAKEASVMISSAGKKAIFRTRDSAIGDQAVKGDANFTSRSPRWVKLVRDGDTFVSYVSADGKTWTKVGSDTISMNSSVEIGLTVSGHDSGATSTATFSDVAVQ